MTHTIGSFITSLGLATPQADNLQGWLQNESNTATVLCHEAAANVASAFAQSLLSIFFGLIIKNDPAQIAELHAYWSNTCIESPSFVVLPRTTSEVSLVLKVINALGLTFAVRSGGHSPNPGWASTQQPGLVIDLRSLNTISVTDDKAIVSLGPGALWGEVYEVLDKYEITVTGGRIPSVGVGGLILGGGFSHFSGQYGLTADSVKNFEIVLGDGTITDVNAINKPDLFWALKGGGANFGIVTRFDLYSIPVHSIWYELAAYQLTQADAIFDAFASWQLTCTDTKATVALIVDLTAITVGLIYSEPYAAQDKPACFAPFKDIPALAVPVPGSNGTVLQLTRILGAAAAAAPADSQISAQLYKEMYAFWRERALAVRESTGANQTFVLQPITAQMVTYGRERGGNCLGLAEENAQWWTTLIDWENAQDDGTVRAVSIATTEKWKSLSAECGLDHNAFVYMNDASRDQNPLVSYGRENLGRLKDISRKYDPDQVFQELQNGGFLLSRV
ncbi:hypothetical protein BDW72DRAFT_202658 [Aspergillus terricola var. indicus]